LELDTVINEQGLQEAVTEERETEAEAVTIELIQEEHPSHVEVVAVTAAGSWHVT